MGPIEQDRLIQKELADFRQRTVIEDTAFPCDVQTVLRAIHEHLFDPGVNVNVVLDRCSIRGARIYARFRYYLKMNIRQYLEHQRLLAAMDLLGRDELDMSHIAFSIGYMDYETFSRAFRRHLGCTPGAYWKKMSEGNIRRKCQKKTAEENVNASDVHDGIMI